MAQYKRSREDYYCNSINSNEHENLPKRSCSISDAGVLLLSDLFADDNVNDMNAQFAEDNVDDMNAQDLQAAQHALLLDMMRSLHQEINSCKSPIMSNSVSHAEVRYALDSPSFGDNYSSSSVVGESAPPVNSSYKMDDEICTVSIDYLLHATDEELGIPPTPLSELNESDDGSNLYSHDTDNVCNDLTLQIELLSGIETVGGIAGHLVAAHAM